MSVLGYEALLLHKGLLITSVLLHLAFDQQHGDCCCEPYVRQDKHVSCLETPLFVLHLLLKQS